MADAPIPYALVNGARFAPVSCEIRLAFPAAGLSLIVIGYKSIVYNRKRSRAYAKGQSVDPLGKTRGSNTYQASFEVHLPEYNALLSQLGDGYGDVFFNISCTYNESPLTVVTDQILGCTFDSTEANVDQTSDDPLYRMIELSPVKIKFRGLDDAAVPLAPPVL